VPTDCLIWSLRHIKDLRADLRAAIREELRRRGETDLKRAALRRAAFREAVAAIRAGLLPARPREHLLPSLVNLLLTGERTGEVSGAVLESLWRLLAEVYAAKQAGNAPGAGAASAGPAHKAPGVIGGTVPSASTFFAGLVPPPSNN
jgi:hypothetical protein